MSLRVVAMNHLQFVNAFFVLSFLVTLSVGNDRISIIIGEDAPKLERFAATELVAQFRQLFEVEVVLAEPKGLRPSTQHVLIGSPVTNSLIRSSYTAQWPKLSGQGICVRSLSGTERPTLLVGGETPVATLWAAYELGHHFGIRYLLHGDIFPSKKIFPQFDGLEIVLEPQFQTRAWETLGPFACGQIAWTLEEQRRVIGQLAKLKYNRIVLSFAPWQPFVHYEWSGVPKSSAKWWHGGPYRVDGDTVGRDAFEGAAIFTHPDFEGKMSYQDITDQATTLARGIIDTAHELGMSAAIAFSPLEFPAEFDKVLPGAEPRGLETLVITPGGAQSPDDPVLLGLARKKINAYLATYPDVDSLYLTLPAVSTWNGHADHAWDMLGAESQIIKGTPLDELIFNVTEQEERESLQSGITALACLRQIVSHREVLKKTDQHNIPVVVAGIDSALYGLLDELNPEHNEFLHGVDASALKLTTNVATLRSVPVESAKRSNLVLTLHDRNVGPLPQCVLGDIHQLVNVLDSQRWNGFLARYPLVGDSAPVLYYLSRASFDSQMTPEQALDQFFTAVCGSGTVASLTKCYDLLEKATHLIYENEPEIAQPLPGMLMRHYVGKGPSPEWWDEAKTFYLQSLSEDGRAIERSESQGRPYLLFLISRLVVGFSHFGTLEALHASGEAKHKEDFEKATEQFEAAIESLHGGVHSFASQTRYRSDLGTIAILNAYGYHPMLKELEALYEAEEEEGDN